MKISAPFEYISNSKTQIVLPSVITTTTAQQAKLQSASELSKLQ